ncbi:MAG TPA: hypothetical protein VM389_10740 [Phycisphaerae bacterium]|nr:hypothetical protein [Phycisphaerae bacterium]
MIFLAAQDGEAARDGLMRVFNYIETFHFPTRAEFLDDLSTLGEFHAAALVCLGLVVLIWGFEYFKTVVIINAAIIGALVGAYVGELTQSANMPLLLGGAGAILLGALAWPTIKYCICLMGAAAGGVIGVSLWRIGCAMFGADALSELAWAGGLLGMAVVGMLTFMTSHLTVMVFTSVQGAVMAFVGGYSLLQKLSAFDTSVRPQLMDNEYLVFVAICIPALIGFALQHTKEAEKTRKKRAVTEKPRV